MYKDSKEDWGINVKVASESTLNWLEKKIGSENMRKPINLTKISKVISNADKRVV